MISGRHFFFLAAPSRHFFHFPATMSGHDHVHGSSSAGDQQRAANATGQKPPNPRYRTKLCRNFPLGTCRYGEHCSYLHIRHAPSPATQGPSPFPTLACSPFFPSIAPSLSFHFPISTPGSHTPTNMATSSSYRPPSEARAQPPNSYRDVRPRAPRSEGPRRISASTQAHSTPPSHAATAANPVLGSDVEKWRLAVSADGAHPPPAPPATPVSLLGRPITRHGGSTAGAGAGFGAGHGGAMNGSAKKVQWEHTQWEDETQPVYPSISISPRQHGVPKLMRHRNQYFKTKPCRFYAEPGGCIKGDRCNFIHEHPDEGRRPSGLAAPAPELTSESDASGAESSVPEESPTTATTSEHTPSVASNSEEQKKRNFYPVTWRVVGGGVMMSGRREACENFLAGHCPEGVDCRYAHPDTSEEAYVVPYAEPLPMYSPMSPLLSPVVFAYPVVYPTISPTQPFAPPAVAGHLYAASPDTVTPSHTPKSGPTYSAMRPNLTITPISPVQPSGMPYTYSPHRVVDGTTLENREHESGPQDLLEGHLRTASAARAVVRPVSTPPAPIQGPEAGVARLFAAEMP